MTATFALLHGARWAAYATSVPTSSVKVAWVVELVLWYIVEIHHNLDNFNCVYLYLYEQ